MTTTPTDAPPTAADPPARWSALRNPTMRAIVTAEAISSFGTQMTFLALPWFVLVTTGSATRMGVVFAVELLPVALLGVPSALLVQRLGVRRAMLACDLVRAPLVALIPALHLLGLLSFGALLVVVFVCGACGAPYLSAQRLLIPETFSDNEAAVVQGNALVEGATRLANLLGPALAGTLIAAMGPVNVLWIDALSFVVSFSLLFFGLPRPKVSFADAAIEGSRGVFEGARFVLRTALLRRVTTAALLFGLFFPMLLASLPVATQERYAGSPTTAGLLFGAWGAGALLGTFGVMRLASKLPPMRMGALASVALALPLWLLPLPLTAWQFGLVLLASGIFTPMLNAPLITLILLRTPEHLRTKAITFVMTANLLAGPIGYGVAGPLLQRTSLATVLLIAAAGVSLAALVLVTLVAVKPEEATDPQPAAA